MQARLLDEVLAGDVTDRHDAADVLDGWRQRYRHHVQNGAPVQFRGDEGGYGKPGGLFNGAGVDHPEHGSDGAADRDAGEDRYQAEDAAAQHGHQQGGDQRGHRNHHRCAVRHQLDAAITGLAHGHVHRYRREGQADGDDHRGDYHRR